MGNPKDYQQQVASCLGMKKWGKKMEVEWKWNNVDEANFTLKNIRQQQKELRFIKKQINVDMKDIRQKYRDKAARVSPGGYSIFQSKGKQRSNIADQKRKLANERDKKLAPFESIKLVIDNSIMQMDSVKLNLEQYIASSKERS